jgi:hypothetical protein
MAEFASVDKNEIKAKLFINSAIYRFLLQFGVLIIVLIVFGLIVFYANRYVMEPIEVDNIPLIERDASALRIAPNDPGGVRIEHKDRKIYNTISPQAKSGNRSQAAPAPNVNKLINKLENKATSVFDVAEVNSRYKVKINLATLKSRPEADAEFRRLKALVPFVFDTYDANIIRADNGLFLIQISGLGSKEDMDEVCSYLTKRKIAYVLRK